MRPLNALLVGLLRLSFWVRLSLVLLCFVLCFVLFLFSQFNGPLLALPLALAVWLFKRRGALISIVLTPFVLAIAISVDSRGFLWSSSLLLGFFTGSLALLTEAGFIYYLRYLLDEAESARMCLLQTEQQRRLAYELQIEAEQAQQRMTNAYEQQRQLNQMKDRFILNVSHELRTPVQALLGHLELLQVFDQQLDADMRMNSLNQAFRASQELQLLVNGVLDTVQLANSERSSKREKLSVRQTVQEVLALVEPLDLQNFTLRLDIPDYLMVVANPLQMRVVVRNLLTNALKYCLAPGSVTISAVLGDGSEQESTSSPQVCICVKDTGPGIPVEEIPFLFERFVRLDRDLSGTVRGTGLGLYISKELVEAMGGRIWVESAGIPGEGSSFYFTLPYAAETMGDGSEVFGSKVGEV